MASGELPNMLFTGTAGLGKTTVAKALCHELGLDYILINGSEEGNIDTLRGKINNLHHQFLCKVDTKLLSLTKLII